MSPEHITLLAYLVALLSAPLMGLLILMMTKVNVFTFILAAVLIGCSAVLATGLADIYAQLA